MSAIIFTVLLILAVGSTTIAFLVGYDNGYLRACRELRETSARRTPAILGATRRVTREKG